MKKKVFAILLTLVLIISVFPIVVLADEEKGLKHKINVNCGEHGTIDVIREIKPDRNRQLVDTIELIPNPDPGYNLTSISASTSESRNTINLNQDFSEINYFDRRYNFSISSDDKIYISEKNFIELLENDDINIEATFAKYEVDKYIDITWTTDKGNVINLSNLTSTEIDNGIRLTIPSGTTIPDNIRLKVDPNDMCSVNISPSTGLKYNLNWLDLYLQPEANAFNNNNTLTVNIDFQLPATQEIIDNINARYEEVTDNRKIELNNFIEGVDNSAVAEYVNFMLVFEKGYQDVGCGDKNHIYIRPQGDPNMYYRNVELVYHEADPVVKKHVDDFSKKLIEETKEITDQKNNILFEVTDMELMNFLFNDSHVVFSPRQGSFYLNENALRFSNQFRNVIDYSNIDVKLSLRGGSGEPFYSKTYGVSQFTYDGVVYKTFGANESQYKLAVDGFSILYVPDETPDEVDAYIKAAKSRTKEYLGIDVDITEAGDFSSFSGRFFHEKVMEKIGDRKYLDKYYIFKVGNKEYYFLIVKDSKRMQNPKLITKDIKTGASIESDSAEVPLDSTIKISELEEGTDEFEKIVSKIGLTDADVFDISLLSNVKGTNIKKLSNGLFEVRIPIKNKKYDNDKLKAYYIRDDGTIEMHDVTVKGGNAYFYTDHFSVYTIGEEIDIHQSEETDNTKTEESTTPKTGDNNLALLFTVLAIFSLMGVVLLVKKIDIKR